MKLATLKNDTRDGALCVISRHLTHATIAYDVAPTMQAALDDWDYCAPLLADLYGRVNREPNGSRFFEIDDLSRFAAPLPRAYQRLDGSAYLSHAERERKARGAELPRELREEPLMSQAASDASLGSRDSIVVEDESWEIDLGGGIAVVVGDVEMGAKREKAAEAIRLVMLANDVTLRGLVPQELAKGLGLVNSKSWAAFSPVAVTPDELGAAWDGRRVHGALVVTVNGEQLGAPDAGRDMKFDFPRLVVHAAHTRPLGAGTIIGSGTVSNDTASAGVACIAEKRALEMTRGAEPTTPFLKYGDRVGIEMKDAEGRSIYGAIEQLIVRHAS
jgi:fumarylacetoacetate (FAA) hydrolase